jgi:hypothetical protein
MKIDPLNPGSQLGCALLEAGAQEITPKGLPLDDLQMVSLIDKMDSDDTQIHNSHAFGKCVCVCVCARTQQGWKVWTEARISCMLSHTPNHGLMPFVNIIHIQLTFSQGLRKT